MNINFSFSHVGEIPFLEKKKDLHREHTQNWLNMWVESFRFCFSGYKHQKSDWLQWARGPGPRKAGFAMWARGVFWIFLLKLECGRMMDGQKQRQSNF